MQSKACKMILSFISCYEPSACIMWTYVWFACFYPVSSPLLSIPYMHDVHCTVPVLWDYFSILELQRNEIYQAVRSLHARADYKIQVICVTNSELFCHFCRFINELIFSGSFLATVTLISCLRIADVITSPKLNW